MIKDYMRWVIGVIESESRENALHIIKHENYGGAGQYFLPHLAMAEDSEFFVFIKRLVQYYGSDNPAVDYIAHAYETDFTKNLKLAPQDKDIYPLDVLIALGVKGKSLLHATIQTHKQFAEYGDEYRYGLHNDLVEYIHAGENSKKHYDPIISNFFEHYKSFRDRILEDSNLMEYLNNLGIDVQNMISPRVKKSDFTKIYQDSSRNSSGTAITSSDNLGDLRNHIIGLISDRGGHHPDNITVSFNKPSSTALAPLIRNDKNPDPLGSIHNGRILQQSLADKLASFRARQEFEIMAQQMGAKFDSPRRHAIFSGPPGTGKTTLAEDVGDFFYDLGILEKGHVHKTTGAKTIGKYVGWTAPLVRDAVKNALGGILFIDEIYQWYDEPRFGQEAVNELLEQMEQHRDNLVVIVAGYKDKVKQVLSMNAGLLSRFSTEFEFTHFTRDELAQILDLNLNKMGISMDPHARATFIDYLEQQKKELGNNFANARTLEVLLDHVVTAHAVTWSKTKSQQADNSNLVHIFANDMLTLNSDDVRTAIAHEIKPEKRRAIGFATAQPE